MSRGLRRREPGQVLGIAAVGLVGMVALLSFVFDAGTFFMLRRELQNVADAAALAGAAGYQTSQAEASNQVEKFARCDGGRCDMEAARNTFVARQWCRNAAITVDPPVFDQTSLSGGASQSPTVQVNVTCRAYYWFGGIIRLQTTSIRANAEAVLVNVLDGNYVDYLAGAVHPVTGLPLDVASRLVT
jgi:uncharacterized membrane protein